MQLAPIILFVYNRPKETRLTLEALSKNVLADQSVLYVYADGAKENASEDDLKNINEVRNLVRSSAWCKEVHLIEAERNKGLANSVIHGVTEIVNRHGKIIVLEDDILTSPYFLKFLNDGLDIYKDERHVYAINSYMFPIETDEVTTFLSPLATSTWGWATWADRWEAFEPTLKYKKAIQSNPFLTARFNLADYNYTSMLDNTNSWGIRWYYSVFVKNGLGAFPTKSMSKNIGFGEDSTHTKGEFLQMDIWNDPIEVELQQTINMNHHAKILNYFKRKEGSKRTAPFFATIVKRIFE